MNGSTYTVTDTRTSLSTGTDTVTGVENFQFAGGTTFTTATLDAVPPTVTAVAYGSNDGTLSVGETVTLTLTFSENVIVAGGTPSLSLDSGGTATLSSGSGTNQLLFTYTVEAGQSSADLAITAFNLNGATVKDAQGNNADMAGVAINPTDILVVDAAGMATFTGTSGDDTANASTGTLTGFIGGSVAELQDDTGDTFIPLAGTDTIVAGSGDDVINLGVGDVSAGDRFDGGEGTDSISLTTVGGSYNLSVATSPTSRIWPRASVTKRSH